MCGHRHRTFAQKDDEQSVRLDGKLAGHGRSERSGRAHEMSRVSRHNVLKGFGVRLRRLLQERVADPICRRGCDPGTEDDPE